jgi:glycosidase
MDSLWCKDAVIYELPVQAFYDSNGDGSGDFPGLIAKLDYLRDLGVSAISLLPFYPSPLGDGLQITEYESVDPRYGTLRDFQTFLSEAHTRSLRVLVEQRLYRRPDFDIDHASFHDALTGATRFWLDMGVDGIRLGGRTHDVGRGQGDDARKVHQLLRELRQIFTQRYPGRVLVADAPWCDEDGVSYFGDGDECHLALNMRLTPRLFLALKQESCLTLAPYGFYWFTMDHTSREMGRHEPSGFAIDRRADSGNAPGLVA